MQKTTQKRQNHWNLLHFETLISHEIDCSKNILWSFSGSPSYVEHVGVKKFGTNAIVGPIFELKKAIRPISRNFFVFSTLGFHFFIWSKKRCNSIYLQSCSWRTKCRCRIGSGNHRFLDICAQNSENNRLNASSVSAEHFQNSIFLYTL